MQNRPAFLRSDTIRSYKGALPYISIILLLLVSSCGQQQPPAMAPPPPALPVMTIEKSNDTTYQDYPASIEGTVNVEIRPQVNGILDKAYVDEGALVTAGQLLFKINELPFLAALNNAVASQRAAEGALVNAQLEIDKLTPLVQNKVVSDYQLKTARAAYDVAKANTEQAKANVSTARINLNYTQIKAPVSGYIGRLERKQGSLVGPSDPNPLTQLSDVHQVHVYFSLGENDFIQFKEQNTGTTLKEKLTKLPPVQLLLADNSVYPKTGRVDVIDGQFDKNTGSITVRATFSNPQGLLRSGNTGKIRLSLQHPSIITVPQSATLDFQNKIFVFAVTDSNKVKKQMISVSGKSGNNYLVADGLQSGQKIVISGLDRLQDGIVIQPQAAATAPSVK